MEKPKFSLYSISSGTKAALIGFSMVIVWLLENLSQKNRSLSEEPLVKKLSNVTIESDEPNTLYDFLFNEMKLKNAYLPRNFANIPFDIYSGGVWAGGGTVLEV